MVDMSMAVWVDSRLVTISFLLTREGVQSPLALFGMEEM